MSTRATATPLSEPATVRRPPRVLRRRIVLAAALAALVAVALWLLLGGEDDGDRPTASIVSVGDLDAVAADAGHAVFWVGARRDAAYELTRTDDGRVYLRYLPAGASAGDPDAEFLAVGSYPQADALTTLKATARRQDQPTVAIAGGGRAFQDADRPTSAYAAYPGVDLQIEVFDPVAGRALKRIERGDLAAVAKPASSTVSVAQLRALDDRLGHPIYWAGAQAGVAYELTSTTDGRVYVRYLPPGADAGSDADRFVTVGTYPQEDAVATLRATAGASGGELLDLPGGGVGYVDADRPTSAYAAFPGTDLQVEVYAQEPARTLELLTSGRLVPVG